MKPVRGRETLLLENGDAEGNVGIKSPPFRLWGKEKALTVFPPTLVWFLSDHPDKLSVEGFLRCRAASCALVLL